MKYQKCNGCGKKRGTLYQVARDLLCLDCSPFRDAGCGGYTDHRTIIQATQAAKTSITPDIHGKLARRKLGGLDGFLLGLQYQNLDSLGKALSELRATIYWLPESGTKTIVWLHRDAAGKLPELLSDRIARLSRFEVKQTGYACERCKKVATPYLVNIKNGVRLVCLAHSPYKSPLDTRAIEAESRAVREIKKRQKLMAERPKALHAKTLTRKAAA